MQVRDQRCPTPLQHFNVQTQAESHAYSFGAAVPLDRRGSRLISL